jgi:DNA-binding NarL/FixJ family response regulator
LSKQNEPLAVALASSPGSVTAVIMMTGKGEARDASNRLSSNPLMPGMTGIELYACLIEAGQEIPTILVTAYPDEAIRARALKDGIACYLFKPFDDNDLMDCIRKAVEGAKPPAGNS